METPPATREEEAEGDDEAAAIECAAELLADDSQRRLWLRAIMPILQMQSHDPRPCDRVQFAFDRLHIAACERATRILRSDLSGDQG